MINYHTIGLATGEARLVGHTALASTVRRQESPPGAPPLSMVLGGSEPSRSEAAEDID